MKLMLFSRFGGYGFASIERYIMLVKLNKSIFMGLWNLRLIGQIKLLYT